MILLADLLMHSESASRFEFTVTEDAGMSHQKEQETHDERKLEQ
jgi:hypothetical protein